MPLNYAVYVVGAPIHGDLPPAPEFPRIAGESALAEDTLSAPIVVTVPAVISLRPSVDMHIDVRSAADVALLAPGPAPDLFVADERRWFMLRPGTWYLQTTEDFVAPTFTSLATADVDEAAQLAHTLTTDEDPDVTFAIDSEIDAANIDAAQFEIAIDGITLTWVGDGVQDFDAPLDDDGDNEYLVRIVATDAAGNVTTQELAVTVNDV